MTATKADLINQVYEATSGMTKAQAREAVELILDIVKSKLVDGEDVLISGFGKFSVKDKAARKGRNPQTGEKLEIDARRVVTFKSSGKLRDKVGEKR